MFKPRSSIIAFRNGFTLVEMMVSIFISVFLLNVLITIFFSVHKNFFLQTELIKVKNNLQFAIEFLRSQIHLSGFLGCAKLTADFPVQPFLPFELNAKNKVSILPDKLQVRYANPFYAIVYSVTLTEVVASSQPVFVTGNILVISDCKKAEIIKVKSVFKNQDKQYIQSTLPLNYHFDRDAQMSRLEINTFYVEKTNRYTKLRQPIYALFMTDITGKKTELIEGVERLVVKQDRQHGIFLNWAFSSSFQDKKVMYSYVRVPQ